MIFVLLFGLVFVGCAVAPNDDPKTLVIRNIPESVFNPDYKDVGGLLGIYPVGTTPQQAMPVSDFLIAGAYLDNTGVIVDGSGPYTVTVPLYDFSNFDPGGWTGSGTFDIYVEFVRGAGYYRFGSVNFSSATTSIPFSRAALVSPIR